MDVEQRATAGVGIDVHVLGDFATPWLGLRRRRRIVWHWHDNRPRSARIIIA